MTAESTVAEIEALGGAAWGIELDVRDHEAVEAMVGRVVQEWGRVDVLVANAVSARHRAHVTAPPAVFEGRIGSGSPDWEGGGRLQHYRCATVLAPESNSAPSTVVPKSD